MQLQISLADEIATVQLGAALAKHLPAGAVVALNGPLGAGKTRLVQAVAAACGIASAEVTSPTFVFVQEYAGDREIIHMDAFRLADEDEFLSLGPEEYFESGAMVFIEWAERVASCLPSERLEIQLEPVANAPEQRLATLTAHGATYEDAFRELGKAF